MIRGVTAAVARSVTVSLAIASTVPRVEATEQAAPPELSAATRPATPDGRERFVPAGDLVLDRWTGLQWSRCSVGQRWVEETRSCIGLPGKVWYREARALESRAWRVPTVAELRTLYDDAGAQLLDPLAFPDSPRTWFWAVGPRGEAAAWGVPCDADGGNDSCYQSDSRAVRLVRRRIGPK